MNQIARLRRKRCLSVDDALEILTTAATAEDDPSLQRLYVAAGAQEPMSSWLGTLHDRLRLLGFGTEGLRRIGAAFEREGMEPEARSYIVELGEGLPYNVALSVKNTEGLIDTVVLRHDIAEAWIERTRPSKRRAKRSNSLRLPIRRTKPERTDCTCAICAELRKPKALQVVDVARGRVRAADGVHEHGRAEPLDKKLRIYAKSA